MYQDKPTSANGKTGFVRKGAGWATNCPDIGYLLTRTCDGKREHVSLENGVSAQAAVYSVGIVRAVLKGLAKACRRNESSQVALEFGALGHPNKSMTCQPCAPGKSSAGDRSKHPTPPPEHYTNHEPKLPGCEICEFNKPQSKKHGSNTKQMRKKAEESLSGEPIRSLDGHPMPKKFGDLVTAAHIVNLDPAESH